MGQELVGGQPKGSQHFHQGMYLWPRAEDDRWGCPAATAERGTGGASQRDDDSIGFAGSGIGFHSRPDQRKKNASTAAAMMSASSAPPTANLSAPPTASMGEYL